jgi:hypothetical protein
MGNQDRSTIMSLDAIDRLTENTIIRTCRWRGFKIEMLKPTKRDGAVFTVSVVSRRNVICWHYKKHHNDYQGHAYLHEFSGEYFIVLCTKTTLDTVIPISGLKSNCQNTPNEFTVGVKRALARKLGLEPAWTEAEEPLQSTSPVLHVKKPVRYVAAQPIVERTPTPPQKGSVPVKKVLILKGTARDVLVLSSLEALNALRAQNPEGEIFALVNLGGQKHDVFRIENGKTERYTWIESEKCK